MVFNPKVKDFLEGNPQKTLIGFMWSVQWRYVLTVYGSLLIFVLVILGIISLNDQNKPNNPNNGFTGGSVPSDAEKPWYLYQGS